MSVKEISGKLMSIFERAFNECLEHIGITEANASQFSIDELFFDSDMREDEAIIFERRITEIKTGSRAATARVKRKGMIYTVEAEIKKTVDIKLPPFRQIVKITVHKGEIGEDKKIDKIKQK